jgi:hypothetical protein
MLFSPERERVRVTYEKNQETCKCNMFISLAVFQIYDPLTNIRFTFAMAYLMLGKDDCSYGFSIEVHSGIMHGAQVKYRLQVKSIVNMHSHFEMSL